VTLLNPHVSNTEIEEYTDSIIDVAMSAFKPESTIKWNKPSADDQELGHCIHIDTPKVN
jgi:hypothetical protein